MINIFVEHVVNKWNPTLNYNESLDNVVHGIVGEICELVEKDQEYYYSSAYQFKDGSGSELLENILDEASDCCFYFYIYPIVTNQEFLLEQFSNCSYDHIQTFSELFPHFNVLIGHSKKYLYHGKKLDLQLLNGSVLSLYSYFLGILNSYEFDVETVMKYNIEKLEKRHGVGKNFKTFYNRLDNSN